MFLFFSSPFEIEDTQRSFQSFRLVCYLCHFYFSFTFKKSLQKLKTVRLTFTQHFIFILFLITATKENLLMLHQKVGCVCVYSVVFIFSPLHFWRSGSVRRGAGYPSIYLVEDFYIYFIFFYLFR
jgi:hypothetical protein